MTHIDARGRLGLEQPTAPLGLLVSPARTPSPFDDARCIRLEFSSRGDRVPARLLLPASSGPHPCVVLEHGAGGSIDAPYMESAAPWVASGIAVASIDLPLHGTRASAKLSERLLEMLAGDLERSPGLIEEFARQSLHDLARLIDALATLPEIDAERIGYAGFSLGAVIGAIFCALDPRPRATALALAGAMTVMQREEAAGPIHLLDPAGYVEAIAPRPLLMLNVKHDARVPSAAAEALFAAAGQPKSHLWFDGEHDQLPGVALKAMLAFLTDHLTG